jgi:hypothetical protein
MDSSSKMNPLYIAIFFGVVFLYWFLTRKSVESFIASVTGWESASILQPLNYRLAYPWLQEYPIGVDYYGYPFIAPLPGPWNQWNTP